MIEFTIRTIWGAINNSYQTAIGAESLGFITWLVLLHIFLAIATLGLGDRTVCDILKPLKKIFNTDTDSIIEGTLELTVAIPRAIIYYISLYFRAYILALRVSLLVCLAIIPALLTPIILSILMGIIYGFSTPNKEHEKLSSLIIMSVYPSFAYWYWRIDGRKLFNNIRNAWCC